MQGQHHARILAALALVHRHGVRRGQFIQLLKIVGHLPVVIPYQHLLLGGIHFHDGANIAVEYVLVVIVFRLHDPVALAVFPPVALHFPALRIERGLHGRVQIARPKLAFLHRRQNLHVAQRLQPKPPWNGLANQFADQLHPVRRRLSADKIKVAMPGQRLILARQHRHLAGIDAVRVAHNLAAIALSENFRQPEHGDGVGLDDIA